MGRSATVHPKFGRGGRIRVVLTLPRRRGPRRFGCRRRRGRARIRMRSHRWSEHRRRAGSSGPDAEPWRAVHPTAQARSRSFRPRWLLSPQPPDRRNRVPPCAFAAPAVPKHAPAPVPRPPPEQGVRQDRHRGRGQHVHASVPGRERGRRVGAGLCDYVTESA